MSTAIGIGEILWDLFPDGKRLGGAPTNFSFHVSQMGIQSAIVSAVGDDASGKEILDILDESDIISFVQVNDKPTGTVTVNLNEDGVPSYVIHEQVAWDYIQLKDEPVTCAKNVDAICYGSLAQRAFTSRKTIQEFLRKTNSEALKIFDINLRQGYFTKELIEESLKLANILKINEEEIRIIAGMFSLEGDEVSVASRILVNFNLQYVAFTKGDRGSWLISRDDKSYIDTPDVTVIDTVGAGDSFTAAMTAGFLQGKSLRETHQLAVEVSAFVCTRSGATPGLNDFLRRKFE